MKKLYLFYIFIFLFCGSAFAQNPAIEWQKCLGGSNYEEAYSILQTTDGGYIVAGFSHSNDGDVTGNHGEEDFWIVKLNMSGIIQWQKCLGGTVNERAHSIQLTIDGGYIIAGYSWSNDGDVNGNHGLTDYWIVKLNSSGNIQWQRSLGGSLNEAACSIQQTNDGGYIVAGQSMSNDGDVTGHHGLTNFNDYWIVKLNSSGIIQWQRSLGGTHEDNAGSIQQTSDGGYIVAGRSLSNDGDVAGNHGGSDYWIVKLNSSGSIEWQKSYGGSNYDNGNSIQQTTDGGYIIAGYSESNDGNVSGNHGGYDYWIVKINVTGTIEWQKSLGGTNYDEAYSIFQTIAGGYVVAGCSNSNSGDVTGNHGGYDYWIVKLNASGTILWQKSLGGSNGDFSESIYQTTDEGYIVAGYSYSNDGDVSGNHGGDYWIVKLRPNVSIDNLNLGNEAVNIYPNPANSLINIKLQGSSYKHLSIYNTSGQEIMKLQDVKQNNTIDISKLPGGLYYIKVQSDKGMAVGKFVKQ